MKDLGLGSKCCAYFDVNNFPCYTWIYTNVCLIVSLELGVHDFCILIVPLIWGLKYHTLDIISTLAGVIDDMTNKNNLVAKHLLAWANKKLIMR